MSVPSAPRVSVWPSCGDGQITLYWLEPTSGAPILNYTVACAAISYSVDVSATRLDHTVTGLTNNVDLTFTITATNATGTGPAESFPKVQAGPLPYGPALATASTLTSTSVIVSWNPSSFAAEAQVKWYLVHTLPSSTAISSFYKTQYSYLSSCVIPNVSTNVYYQFLVRGVNDAGYCVPRAFTSSLYVPPPAFLPTQVAGLQLWLDASVSSNFVLSGSNVTRWYDRSGNARDATTFSGTVALQSNSINGSNSVYFNFGAMEGSNTFSNIPSSIVPTVFVAMKTTGSGQLVTRFFGLYKSGYEAQMLTRFDGATTGSTIMSAQFQQDFRAQTSWPDFVNPFVVMGQHLVSYNNMCVNGNPAVATNTQSGGRPSNYGYTDWRVGARNSGNAEMNGNLCEVLLYHGVLNNIDRQRLEAYLAWKWGFQNSLAATHPFKTDRPLPPLPQTAITSNRIIHFDASSWNGTGTWPNQGSLGASNDATLVTGTRTKNAAGNGVVFNTSNYYLLSSIALQTQYTLSAWAKLTSTTFNGGAIFTEKDIDAAPGSRAINMAIATSGANVFGFLWKTNGQATVVTSNLTAMSNYWFQYAYTVSTFNTTSTMCYTYSNGALVGSTIGVFTPTTNQKEFYIGANDEVWQGQPKMLGEIGEISVYNRPLTYAEIRQNYDARWATYYP